MPADTVTDGRLRRAMASGRVGTLPAYASMHVHRCTATRRTGNAGAAGT